MRGNNISGNKMKLVLYDQVEDFKNLALPIYMASEAIHCIALGALTHMGAEKPESTYLFSVEDNGKRYIGFMSHPYPMALTQMPDEALDTIIRSAKDWEHPVKGVLGADGIAPRFATRWTKQTGQMQSRSMKQGIYQLDNVIFPKDPPGAMRIATSTDFDLLVRWNLRFNVDCKLPVQEGSSERYAELAIANQNRYLYEVGGQAVCMAGLSGKTPNGIRVSWVYTPDEHRGKGYASHLVAALSQKCLNDGNKFCFLYTDLENPTSNKIYTNVGYQKMAESEHIAFD
jgi:predicted GNAT family acetyltransferase